MQEYVYEESRVGAFKVKVLAHDDYSLVDGLNDKPVYLFGRDRGCWKIADQSKLNFPSHDVLRAIAEGDSAESVLNELCADSWSNEWRWTSGKVWADHAEWNRPRYFKSSESALAAMFFAEYGRAYADLKVESFTSRVYQGGGTFYLAFWQSELDSYAGVKGAKSCIADLQHILDGDVFGYVVSGPYGEDSDGEETEADGFDDYLDSCWGFIGDSSYCLSEGEDSARWHDAQYREKRAHCLSISTKRLRRILRSRRWTRSFPLA